MKNFLLSLFVLPLIFFSANEAYAFMPPEPQKVYAVNISAFDGDGEKVFEEDYIPVRATIPLDVGNEKKKHLLLYFENDAPKDVVNFSISGDDKEGRVQFSLPFGVTDSIDFCGFRFVVKFYETEAASSSWTVW